jgi:hypothetical protein
LLKKTDAVVYSTLERTKLARAAVYIQGAGVHLKSISELVRIIVDTFDNWLDKSGVPPIETTHEASAILQHMFNASLNPGDRRKKVLLENLQQDEELDFDPLPKPRGRQPNWTENDDKRLQNAANKALETPRIKQMLEDLRNGKKDE